MPIEKLSNENSCSQELSHQKDITAQNTSEPKAQPSFQVRYEVDYCIVKDDAENKRLQNVPTYRFTRVFEIKDFKVV